MTLIELRFLSGRYHSTPWGRHVNEGQPEWPPSPYRLLRALYDAWKRKFPAWPSERVEPLLAALAGSVPSFRLPPVTFGHTRAFLPTNRTDPSDRKLIFDGFVVMDPSHSLLMGWPSITLDAAQQSDLAELLSSIHYLGRSESWVSASLQTATRNQQPPWNLEPASGTADLDSANLLVACALPPEVFNRDEKRVKLVQKASGNGDPGQGSAWLRALTFSTQEVLKGRLSDPPALYYARYQSLPETPRRAASAEQPDTLTPVNTVLFALESKVLPLVTATLEISERVRVKLMGLHRRVKGDPKLVSPRFSGKDTEGKALQGHQHSFIWPLDRDQDGRLDHLLVVCRKNYTKSELLAFDRLTSLWQPDGLPDILCVPLQFGSRDSMLQDRSEFISVTPFVPTHHHRKGRGEFSEWLKKEVCRECAHAGLPSPAKISPLEQLVLPGGHGFFWIEFRRNRRQETPRTGYGFRLTFANPVRGPFALGHASHFGLGLFAPTAT